MPFSQSFATEDTGVGSIPQGGLNKSQVEALLSKHITNGEWARITRNGEDEVIGAGKGTSDVFVNTANPGEIATFAPVNIYCNSIATRAGGNIATKATLRGRFNVELSMLSVSIVVSCGNRKRNRHIT